MPLGAQARGFTFTDTAGKKLTLSDFKGKWVLINFWATWCPPCLKEIPDLVSLYESRKDVMIIGIAMDYRDPKTVLKYVKSMSISYPDRIGRQKNRCANRAGVDATHHLRIRSRRQTSCL